MGQYRYRARISMKYLIPLLVILSCGVFSRNIVRRSLAPSNVYLPPPQDTPEEDETTTVEPLVVVKDTEDEEVILQDSAQVEIETEVPLSNSDTDDTSEVSLETGTDEPEIFATEAPEIQNTETNTEVQEEVATEAVEEETTTVEELSDPDETLAVLEPVENILDPRIVDKEEDVPEEVVIQTKPSSGYWIEVSGDRDFVVTYQE